MSGFLGPCKGETVKANRQSRRNFRCLTATRPQAPAFLAAADLADGYLLSSSPREVKGREERICRSSTSSNCAVVLNSPDSFYPLQSRGKRNALRGGPQFFVERDQTHRDNSRAAKNGHKIVITVPSRDDMQVEDNL